MELGRKQFRKALLILPFAVILYALSIIQQDEILRYTAYFFTGSATVTFFLGIKNQYHFWRNAHEEVNLTMHGLPVYQDEEK